VAEALGDLVPFCCTRAEVIVAARKSWRRLVSHSHSFWGGLDWVFLFRVFAWFFGGAGAESVDGAGLRGLGGGGGDERGGMGLVLDMITFLEGGA
jgi:hypothetical protein